jgi:Cdc6-like AAA superfamily ATPase
MISRDLKCPLVHPPTVFDVLVPYVVHDALYNSCQRQSEHAITCLPQTGTQVIHHIKRWGDSMTSTLVFWLHGPVGTGKTTVSHTIAEEYNSGRLAALFFFWRKTGP